MSLVLQPSRPICQPKLACHGPFPSNGIPLRYSTSLPRSLRSPRLYPSTFTEPIQSESATMATAPVIPSLDVTKSQKGFQVRNDGTVSLSCMGRLA